MTGQGILLKDFRHDDKSLIMEWNKVSVRQYTIFHRVRDDFGAPGNEADRLGFHFYVVHPISSPSGSDWDALTDGDIEVLVDAKGVAYFDGLRHIYHHPERDGYGYYVDTKGMSQVFSALRDLEERYCRIDQL